jgi:tetratricopeptide (TPR) repeat protein
MSAIVHAKLGRFDAAVGEFEAVLEIAERIGKPHSIGVACNNLGALLMRMGRYAEAEETLKRAHAIHLRRDRSMLVSSLLNLAETARRAGDLPSAVGHYQEMAEHARVFEFWSSEAVAYAGLSLCLLEVGRTAEAREGADRAMSAVADREEWFEDREFVEILLARLAHMDGHTDDALRRLGRAAEILATFDVYGQARVEVERARMLVELDPDAARETLERVAALTAGFPGGFAREIEELRVALGAREDVPVAGVPA